jgi:anaerobic selenocysteine-containing dehydrogenase
LTRTAKARQLWQREPEPFVQINAELAEHLGVVDGEIVQVSSRRGTVRLKAQISDRVPPGLVFVPMHWGDLFSTGNAVNYLTLSAIGRVAKQPELKCCAVAVEKVAAIGERAGEPASPVAAAMTKRVTPIGSRR